MTGMTAQELRDCVQFDPHNEGVRLEMGSGVVLQYFPGVTHTLQEIHIEGRQMYSSNLWELDYFCSDDEVNDFFDVMGGIAHVLGIIE